MSNERKPHKHAAVIKAWADGKVVQVKCPGHEWEDINYEPILWMSQNNYRVKPEPVKVRYRVYLDRGDDGEISACATNDLPGYISPNVVEQQIGFVEWIHADWQEVEVAQ